MLFKCEDNFEQSLGRVQKNQDKKNLILGKEVAETQSVQSLFDVVDVCLIASREAVCQHISQLIFMHDCLNAKRRCKRLGDKNHNYLLYLILACTHLKCCCVSSVLHKISSFSTVSLFLTWFVPPCFFVPNHLAAVANTLPKKRSEELKNSPLPFLMVLRLLSMKCQLYLQSLSCKKSFPFSGHSNELQVTKVRHPALHQKKVNQTTASVYCSTIQLLTFVTDNMQNAVLGGTRLSQCSGNH